MKKQSNGVSENLISFVNKFFEWETKRNYKKALKEQKREQRFGKYRLIKNKRTRAIISLGSYLAFFITLFLILFLSSK